MQVYSYGHVLVEHRKAHAMITTLPIVTSADAAHRQQRATVVSPIPILSADTTVSAFLEGISNAVSAFDIKVYTLMSANLASRLSPLASRLSDHGDHGD